MCVCARVRVCVYVYNKIDHLFQRFSQLKTKTI